MSHIFARELLTISRLLEPATEISKRLDLPPGSPLVREVWGHIVTLEIFFSWALEGLAREEGRTENQEISPASASSALRIIREARSTLPGPMASPSFLREQVTVCRNLVREMADKRHITGTHGEREVLLRVLNSLIQKARAL